MAATLVLTFADASGNDVKINYSHADSEVEACAFNGAPIDRVIKN